MEIKQTDVAVGRCIYHRLQCIVNRIRMLMVTNQASESKKIKSFCRLNVVIINKKDFSDELLSTKVN